MRSKTPQDILFGPEPAEFQSVRPGVPEFAQFAFRHQLRHCHYRRVKFEQMPHLKYPAGAVGQLAKYPALGSPERERFLTKDVFSRLKRLLGQRKMQHGGRGDGHRVDPSVLKREPDVRNQPGIGIGLFECPQSRRINIADRIKGPQFLESPDEVFPPVSCSHNAEIGHCSVPRNTA